MRTVKLKPKEVTWLSNQAIQLFRQNPIHWTLGSVLNRKVGMPQPTDHSDLGSPVDFTL